MTDVNTWLLLTAIYVVKFLLKIGRTRLVLSLPLFAATVASSIVFIHQYLVDSSETFNVDPKALSIGIPVMVLFIPTATFGYDILSKREWTPKALLGRYVAEIALFPVWAYFWIVKVSGPVFDWWWL